MPTMEQLKAVLGEEVTDENALDLIRNLAKSAADLAAENQTLKGQVAKQLSEEGQALQGQLKQLSEQVDLQRKELDTARQQAQSATAKLRATELADFHKRLTSAQEAGKLSKAQRDKYFSAIPEKYDPQNFDEAGFGEAQRMLDLIELAPTNQSMSTNEITGQAVPSKSDLDAADARAKEMDAMAEENCRLAGISLRKS